MDRLTPPDLGPWRTGNTGTEGVWQFDSGQPGRSVLITALVHGNEVCGAWALLGLLQAGIRPTAGRLTLAFANLTAFDQWQADDPRASRKLDEDLNRVWQADKLADPHNRERQRALALLPFVQQADWLLDLHSMSAPSPPLQLIGLHPRHQGLACEMGSPAHLVRDGGHAEGTRLRDYGRWGLSDAESPDSASLLIECGQHEDPASRAVAQDQCRRFLIAAGSLTDADANARLGTLGSDWQLPPAERQWRITVTEAVTARDAQFRFTAPVPAMGVIAEAGTAIGDNAGQTVRTPYPDCVLVMPAVGTVPVGTTAVRFGQQQALSA